MIVSDGRSSTFTRYVPAGTWTSRPVLTALSKAVLSSVVPSPVAPKSLTLTHSCSLADTVRVLAPLPDWVKFATWFQFSSISAWVRADPLVVAPLTVALRTVRVIRRTPRRQKPSRRYPERLQRQGCSPRLWLRITGWSWCHPQP